METLTNVEVGYVKLEPKIKEGKYGEYKIWDFTLSGDKDRWFGYIEKNNLVPEKGMKILVLKYESQTNVKDGKTYYNNYVKELTPDSNWYSGKEPENTTQKPPSATGSTQGVKRDSSITMFASYSKDLMVALINNGLYLEMDLEDIARIVAQTGVIMYDKVNGTEHVEPAMIKPEPTEPIDPDEPPFPDEPPPY